MMKRFARKRRGGGGGGESGSGAIDAAQWLPKIVEQGIVETESLEAWTDSGVPDRVAVIGRGARADGSTVLVAFSPTSATDAMLGGLAAAQKAATESEFKGELLLVAPQWPAGARRVLGLIGRTVYSVEPIAAPVLSEGRVVVEAEMTPQILATNASQLASRMVSPESRSAFSRAAAALEGLAAKHGGCVRVGADRLELVVLARRVAELRADGDSAVLEVQIGGRSVTPLSGADLAGALDGLEGQLRRRLNDRKVRSGEEGLRGRVVAQLASGSELRSVRPWPQPGTDHDAVDAVGVNADGDPVVVAVRQEFEWRALGAVLESLAPIGGLLPVLFAETAPPLRLSGPRLLLAGERFVEGLEAALSSLTVAYELRDVSGDAGAGLDLVSRSAGEGAETRTPRRGRQRGGRGRGASEDREDNGGDSEDSGSSAGEGRSRGRGRGGRGRRGGAAAAGAEAADAGVEGAEDSSRSSGSRGDDSEEGGRGRGRGRGRSRSRRGGRSSADEEESSDKGRSGPRFEELSLMDLDDDRGASVSDDAEPARERSGRSRRRGRRGASEGKAGDESDGATRMKVAEDVEEAVTEEDLVDADDLSEILARLADDVPEFDGESSEESYDDEEEVPEDGNAGARAQRESRRRSRGASIEGDDEARAAARKRSAILVHADPDSLFAAVLLARDIRQLEGLWVYPQEELMTFFRSIATDLRDDTPIFLIGFSPSPAHDVVQAASLYRGRLHWFDRQAWPPEDRHALGDSIGGDSIFGGEGIDSSLPLVLETCNRRSRFSDKLVDLATGRFTQHDFERWGRLWRHRISEIAAKSGDIRSDVAPLLAGRPSDLTKEAALVEIPAAPREVAWVAERDFRLVHFGGHVMVVLDVDPQCDLHLAARIARERYNATLSLARIENTGTFVFAGDETTGKRSLDYMAIAEHLVEKLEWVEPRADADHVSRFHVRDLDRHPERLEEVVAEIAMGRSMLER